MTADFLGQIREYNIRKAEPHCGRCALLVVDMQEFFRPLVSHTLHNIITIINTCRKKNIPVILTRHGHKDLSVDGGILAEWWGGDLARYGMPEWQILKDIHVEKEDIIIDKNRYSAFYGTDLEKNLRALSREELIITGVMTNCCCETTARDAFMRDFRVFFVADATATANEELHLASLKNLAYAFAHVVSTENTIQALNTGE